MISIAYSIATADFSTYIKVSFCLGILVLQIIRLKRFLYSNNNLRPVFNIFIVSVLFLTPSIILVQSKTIYLIETCYQFFPIKYPKGSCTTKQHSITNTVDLQLKIIITNLHQSTVTSATRKHLFFYVKIYVLCASIPHVLTIMNKKCTFVFRHIRTLDKRCTHTYQ